MDEEEKKIEIYIQAIKEIVENSKNLDYLIAVYSFASTYKDAIKKSGK